MKESTQEWLERMHREREAVKYGTGSK